MLNKYPIAYVEWVDSKGMNAWTSLDEIEPSVCKCISVGFLIKEKDDVLVVVPHITLTEKDNQGDGIIVIPMKAVTKYQRIFHDPND